LAGIRPALLVIGKVEASVVLEVRRKNDRRPKITKLKMLLMMREKSTLWYSSLFFCDLIIL